MFFNILKKIDTNVAWGWRCAAVFNKRLPPILAEMFLKSIVRKRKHNRSNVSFFVQKQRLKSKRLLNQILVTISLGFFLYNKKQFL